MVASVCMLREHVVGEQRYQFASVCLCPPVITDVWVQPLRMVPLAGSLYFSVSLNIDTDD